MISRLNLGTTISLFEIKENVKGKKSSEFAASFAQVNLDSLELRNYIKQTKEILFPPIGNRAELFKTLWLIEATTDSLKWDYITLLTFLNDGKIYYKAIDDFYLLVSIVF